MQLRKYQKDAVRSVHRYFARKEGNPIVAMPTGTGKSLVIGALIRLVNEQNKRVIVLTHVKELILQDFERSLDVYPGMKAGIYSAGLNRRDTKQPVIFAGIASVRNRAEELGPFDLVLIDECQLVSDADTTMYQTFIASLKALGRPFRVVGLSATPWRMKTGLLTEGSLFDDVCFDLTSKDSFNKLVENGHLAPLTTKDPLINYDVRGVPLRGGEFIPGLLQKAVSKTGITESVVDELVERAQKRDHWLIFASGIKHCGEVQAALEARGVPCGIVHSKISDEEREQTLADFKSGKLRAVVNNNVLTTGFDFPGIDCIAVLRPTMSPGLWVQMLGRGTRVCPGKKDCLVLDFAGNTKRLGPINDITVSSRRKGKRKGTAPVRVCEKCRTINHASVRICIECGFEFPRVPWLTAKASGLDVVAKKPVEVVMDVSAIAYKAHTKQGGRTSLRVTYRVGLTTFNEYVCLEHTGYARRRAHDWWDHRSNETAPATVKEALLSLEGLREPKKIKVQLGSKYPRVLDYIF